MKPLPYVALFAATVGLIWSALFLATAPSSEAADRQADFGSLKPGEVIITRGLNRRERAFLSIDYYRDKAPPRVGLFGNHMFTHFERSAFGNDDPAYFFNYYYANLSLTELFALVRYFEDRRMLPTGTILVQLTPPNNDNGLHMLGFAGELPSWMIYSLVAEEWRDRNGTILDTAQRLAGTVSDLYSAMLSNLYFTTSYGTFIERLSDTVHWTAKERVFDTALCKQPSAAPAQQASRPAWQRLVPSVLREVDRGGFRDPSVICTQAYLSSALQADGSSPIEFSDTNLVLDENPLDPREADSTHRKITNGDEPEIALTLRRIAAIGARNGAKVVFVVPPVYETERDGPGNRVLTRALAMVPDLNIVDHRTLRGPRELFARYDHPSPAYFRLLVAELRQQGLLPD